ncbi:MAG: hypothetical protein H7259_05000, partial [Cytophagales bacterium]|nr:hypothetical protein [Cytophaga sp.]
MNIQTIKAALFLFSFVFIQSTFAQTANEYLHGMNVEFDKIKNEYFDYINQVAHGKSAKKAESKRMEVLTTIKGSKNTISKMKGFNGSTTLRDSLISFLNLNYNVMANDYAKIMDLEAISEQSYDYMEAYIMAQDIANKKIDDGSKMVSASVEVFAKANGIELKESTDSRDRMLKIASSV